MHLLRVSPSQRSGSSAGSRLGGSTFLCTGRLLGTGDPQRQQSYSGSWEVAKGVLRGVGRAGAGAGAACPATASRGRCLHHGGGEKSIGGG